MVTFIFGSLGTIALGLQWSLNGLRQKLVKILRGGRITEDTDLLLLDRRGGEELDGEGAEGVEGEDVLPDRGDAELPVVLGPRLWPVLVTLDLQLIIISR